MFSCSHIKKTLLLMHQSVFSTVKKHSDFFLVYQWALRLIKSGCSIKFRFKVFVPDWNNCFYSKIHNSIALKNVNSWFRGWGINCWFEALSSFLLMFIRYDKDLLYFSKLYLYYFLIDNWIWSSYWLIVQDCMPIVCSGHNHV